MYASERNRPDVMESREDWLSLRTEFEDSRLVFLDESGVNIDMTRRYGRAENGSRVNDMTPLSTPINTSIISSIRLNGDTTYHTVSGSVNGEIFKDYIKNKLVPSLKPGDIVIMDNLRSHKVSGVVGAIESAGAYALYLPPYSPDLNPIEQMWSKIKSVLRKIKARTADALAKAIPVAFNSISDKDAKGWFTHSGYCH